MRITALIALCLLASPLWAELAEPAEAHSALWALKDRLRVMYEKNGKRVDARWRVEDCLPAKELTGTYFSPKDYSLQFNAARPSWARVQCTGGGYYKGPLAVEIDFATGASQWIEPGPSKEELWAERLLAIEVAAALLAGPALSLLIFRRKRWRLDFRVAVWLLVAGVSSLMVQVLAGVGFGIFVTEHTPEPAAGIASFGGLLAFGVVCVGFVMFMVAMIFPANLVADPPLAGK
jgi:hypothetical protein